MNRTLISVYVQSVFDGRLEPNEPRGTWRNEKANINYVAVSSEITVLWQIFQVGNISHSVGVYLYTGNAYFLC